MEHPLSSRETGAKKRHRRLVLRIGNFLIAAAITMGFASDAAAISPEVIVLEEAAPFGPGSSALGEVGKAVAVNQQWILAGQPALTQIINSNDGAVLVYRARDGRYFTTLFPSTILPDAEFGTSVALCDDLAVVGAPGENGGSGTVYVFNVRTGKELARILSPVASGGFGLSVAASGQKAVIGAPFANTDEGRAYVIDLAEIAAGNGPTLVSLVAMDGEMNDGFGQSVAIYDSLVLVGAPGDDSAQGSGYVFSTDGTLIEKISMGGNGAAGDLFGFSVALRGPRALIGAPGTAGASGAAYVFEIRQGFGLFVTTTMESPAGGDGFGWQVAMTEDALLVSKVGLPLGSAGGEVLLFSQIGERLGRLLGTKATDYSNDQFGFSMAVSENRLVIGAPATEGGKGVAYFYPLISGPEPGFREATTKQSAPGIYEASLRRFGDACLSPANHNVSFCANLVGRGATRGRNKAIFGEIDFGGQQFVSQTRNLDSTGFLLATTLAKPNANHATALFFEGRSPLGGSEILRFDGTNVVGVHGVGMTLPNLGNAKLARYRQRKHSLSMASFAISAQLRRDRSTGVNATNDSTVLLLDHDGNTDDFVREGSLLPGTGETAGQLNRVSFLADRIMMMAPIVGSNPGENQMLFEWTPGGGAGAVIQKGQDVIPGTNANTVRTFLGETNGMVSQSTLFRAVLNRNATTTGRNNEALICEDGFSFRLVAREGENDGALAQGEEWGRFLNYWAMHDGSNPRALFTAKLRGQGVRRSNDCGLFFLQSDGDIVALIREGDPLPGGCGGERVGVIQRVAADSQFGTYAILVSVAGANRQTNQAILMGNCTYRDITKGAVRRPWLALRKGRSHQENFGATGRIVGFRIPDGSVEPTGAGGTGLPNVVGASAALIEVRYSDRTSSLSTFLTF